MKVATRRLLEEQTAVDVVLGSGEKSDAMWHVPQTVNCVTHLYVCIEINYVLIVSKYVSCFCRMNFI